MAMSLCNLWESLVTSLLNVLYRIMSFNTDPRRWCWLGKKWKFCRIYGETRVFGAIFGECWLLWKCGLAGKIWSLIGDTLDSSLNSLLSVWSTYRDPNLMFMPSQPPCPFTMMDFFPRKQWTKRKQLSFRVALAGILSVLWEKKLKPTVKLPINQARLKSWWLMTEPIKWTKFKSEVLIGR